MVDALQLRPGQCTHDQGARKVSEEGGDEEGGDDLVSPPDGSNPQSDETVCDAERNDVGVAFKEQVSLATGSRKRMSECGPAAVRKCHIQLEGGRVSSGTVRVFISRATHVVGEVPSETTHHEDVHG